MKTRLAIIGFRHGHIYDILSRVRNHPEVELVACCEDHEPTRTQVLKDQAAPITHSDYRQMLDTVPCDVVAVGDYYARRGEILIAALQRGKHVIGDKPLCARLSELDEIERLAREQRRVVGCMLDIRDCADFIGLRETVRAGRIGEVQAIDFQGQHPLNYGARAAWYFEEGKHGGTINDIAIHGIDAIPWITGRRIARINAARNWHVRPKEAPHFLDAAQMMLTLDNGAGVLGDVSYLAPDSFGYSLPQYWRFTVWGTEGMVEALHSANQVTLCQGGEKTPRVIALPAARPGGYLAAFLQEIRGARADLHISSAEVLASSRVALRVQDAALRGLTNVDL